MLLSDLFENDKQLAEKWSAKYKRSINCNNPKGFSQRAHCQGRKKTNESVDQEAGIGIDGQSFKFKVKDLIALANNYPVTKINPKQFENQLAGREEDPTQSMARAQKAELKYPIIVVKRKNGELWIADGTHRVHKAIMMDLPTIDARIIPVEDMTPFLSEGPIWDKVKKTAAAGAVAGAAGYGALTGQFGDKAKEPARAPVEITIPGGDLEQPKPEVKKEKVKLEPSTATNADPKMEKLVFLTALRSGIKGKELAQFMGQVAHETLGFQRLVEVGSKEYFNRYDPEHSPQKAKILGNVKKGDGLRYKGRGFIQITGRDNYKRAGQALGIDLVNNPKLASNPEVAAKIAVWYWKSRVKPTVDDYTDTIGVTSKINPSMNGLGDRDMNFRHYLQRLQLED